jgi:hypothetical protein
MMESQTLSYFVHVEVPGLIAGHLKNIPPSWLSATRVLQREAHHLRLSNSLEYF